MLVHTLTWKASLGCHATHCLRLCCQALCDSRRYINTHAYKLEHGMRECRSCWKPQISMKECNMRQNEGGKRCWREGSRVRKKEEGGVKQSNGDKSRGRRREAVDESSAWSITGRIKPVVAATALQREKGGDLGKRRWKCRGPWGWDIRAAGGSESSVDWFMMHTLSRCVTHGRLSLGCLNDRHKSRVQDRD